MSCSESENYGLYISAQLIDAVMFWSVTFFLNDKCRPTVIILYEGEIIDRQTRSVINLHLNFCVPYFTGIPELLPLLLS